MNNKPDRLKAALRENLKRRKAHLRDREGAKNPASGEEAALETRQDKSGPARTE